MNEIKEHLFEVTSFEKNNRSLIQNRPIKLKIQIQIVIVVKCVFQIWIGLNSDDNVGIHIEIRWSALTWEA